VKLTNNIPKDSGFKTPDKYFTNSIISIKDRIALEKALGSKKSSGFTVPERYFTDNIIHTKNQIELEKVLDKEIASGFTIPDSYFEDNIIHTKNQIELEKILGKESKTNFTIPDSYFENNLSNIKDRIDLENKLGNNAGTYDVPKDYFNNLNERLNVETLSRKQNTSSTTLSNEQTKVIQLKQYIKPIIGIAASILLIAGIFLSQDTSKVNTDNIELAAITDYFDTYNEILYHTELEELLTEEDLLSLEKDVAIEEDVLIDYLEDRIDSYDYYLQ